jgi:anti-sigma regulatory factor (Ser/Thr protein kinase)
MRHHVGVTVAVERVELQAEPGSVGEARRFVRRVLEHWGFNEMVDTVALLTSELATNAVLHARTAFAVVVTSKAGDIRVDVLDNSSAPPRHRQNTTLAATGRGVAMVDRLATAWGATAAGELHGYVKGVWFTVPVPGLEDALHDGDWLDGL